MKASTLIVQELNSGKAGYYYKKSIDAIKSLDIAEAYDNLLKAIKFRNDIETDVFKRYLVAFSTRLASFKSRSTFFRTSHSTIQHSYQQDVIN